MSRERVPLELTRMVCANDATIEWEQMMRAFPTDGWDGAADMIAGHDQMVRSLERQLDEREPDWYDQLDPPSPFRRRTPPLS